MVSSESESLSLEFKAEVNKEIDYIGEYPEYYQVKYKELRQSLVARFPYSIFYLVEEEPKQVVVLGVLHTSRNPETVRKKIRKINFSIRSLKYVTSGHLNYNI